MDAKLNTAAQLAAATVDALRSALTLATPLEALLILPLIGDARETMDAVCAVREARGK